MKKAFSCAVVFIMLLTIVLTGCSGNSAANNATSVSNSQSPAASSNAASEQTVDNTPATVTFMSWETEDAMKPLIDAFKAQYPNITIDFQFTPPANNGYVQKLKTLLLTDSAPDVYVMALENRGDVMGGGFALDLTDQPFMQAMSQFNKDTYSLDGKVYGYAQSAWAGGIFYNKKIFSQVGVDVPKKWSDFIEVCKKLKGAGVVPYLENFQDMAVNIVTGLFVTETHFKDKNFDNEVNSGAKKYVDGWTVPVQLWYNDMVKTGLTTEDMLGVSWDQQQTEFATEKVAMTPGGPWCIPIFTKANPNLDFGLIPWPGVTESHWSGSAGIAYCVNAKTKVKDAALKLLDFMSTDTALNMYSQGTQQMISVKGAQVDINPILKDASAGLLADDIWNPAAGFKFSSALTSQLQISLQDCFAGKIPPEQVAKELDKKFAELNNQ